MDTKIEYTGDDQVVVGRIAFALHTANPTPVEAAAFEGIREFFALLDVVEVSDFGREFHPTTISSCRINDFPKLCAALAKMRGVL